MIDFFHWILDFLRHPDVELLKLTQQYGGWTYAVLFAIVFTETGVVLFPFLPGDSLLFVAGSIAAQPNSGLELGKLMGLLFTAALLGDNLNFAIGNYIGPRAFSGRVPFLKQSYLQQTQDFYARHGGKTIIMARFVPIVRTFAPFVAGVGSMTYRMFISYSIAGAALWVVSITLLGYFTGNMDFVKHNFEKLIYLIVLLSVLPPVLTGVKSWLAKKPA